MINRCRSRLAGPSTLTLTRSISMTIYTNTPYTYRIGWSKTGMNYYGVRYAKNCHPSDLFVTYFTSSKYVAEYIKEHGDPDIIEIRKIFTGDDRRAKSILYEHRVLKRMNVVKRQDYLNKHDGRPVDILTDPDVMRRWAASMEIVRNDPAVKAKAKLSYQENAKRRAAADMTIYQFYHKKTGKTETCSKTQLAYMYKLNITHLNHMADGIGNRKSVAGWCIATRDNANGNSDKTKYIFEHKDGATEHLTRKEMEKKYSINSGNMCEVMNGNRKSCKGWRVINNR